MKLPDIHSSKIVYEGFYKMRTDLLVRHDGETLDYTSLEIAWDAAVVIAEDEEGRLILNREYRHPVRQFVLCCPGGKLEEGEDPIDCAKRELFEETGYEAKEFIPIGSSYPIPGICNQKIYFVLAKGAFLSAPQTLDPFEFIETVLSTEKELKTAILNGAAVDGILCTALWYKTHACL